MATQTQQVAPNANLTAIAKNVGVDPNKIGVDEGYGMLNVDFLNKYADAQAAKKIVSSSSALDTRDAKAATTAAGNAMTTPDLSSIALSNFNTGMSETSKAYKDLMDATKLSYDTQLAQSNSQYASLMRDMELQKNQQLQLAESQAESLNPYSTARGATTASNFSRAIVTKYNDQAMKLQQQADMAQQALAAGQTEAYAKISNAMAQSNQAFRSQMLNFMQEQNKQLQQEKQFQQNFGLNLAQLDLSTKNYELSRETKATDDFRSLMQNLSGSPELQNDIKSYFSTGKISEGLMPIIKQAQGMGLSANEALGIFQYQTDSVRKQQDLENYRAQMQYMAQLRLAQSADRQTKAQLDIANRQAVGTAASNLIANGKMPGTIDYALGTAKASEISPSTLSAAEVSKYTQMGTLINQFSGLKTRIGSVNESSAFWNTLLKYAGKDVSSIADSDLAVLNSNLTALSGTIGKTFYGESGNLSNTDIQRVLNVLPTSGGSAEVRNALYNGMVDVASQNAIMTLQNHAAAGYAVSNYAPVVEALAKKANESRVSTTPTTGLSQTTMDILNKHNVPLQ